MKKILLAVVIVLFLSGIAFAGAKEELLLKQSYLKEHSELLSLQVKLIQIDFNETQKALKTIEDGLAAIKKAEDEKTKEK